LAGVSRRWPGSGYEEETLLVKRFISGMNKDILYGPRIYSLK
jgi:hypothetical protein